MAAFGDASIAETISASDKAVYKRAFEAAAREDWQEARRLASTGKHPLPAKVILWMDLVRPGPGRSFSELSAFLQDNPDWPSQKSLQSQAERAMPAALPAEATLHWFHMREPLTLEGAYHLGQALLATGKKAEATAMVRKAWRERDAFDAVAESRFLSAFAKSLTADDHVARLDRLLWDNENTAALRVMSRVDAGHRALAEARMGLRGDSGKVEKLIAAVPQKLLRDPGLIYERARWRRRHDEFATIPQLFDAPLAAIARPDLMWRELDDAARKALTRGQAKIAYRLAKQHGAKDGTVFAEGEWLAGWIALRFLKDSAAAYTHFTRLHDGVTSSISKARGAYWAGRASDDMGNKPQAEKWYGMAARYSMTYYGQLAAQKNGHRGPLVFPPLPEPSKDDRAAFARQELAQAIEALGRVGAPEQTKPFINRMIELTTDPVEHRMIVELASSLGRDDLTVSAAKSARAAGTDLVDYLFPVRKIAGGDGPEKALVLAVIRQESAFQADAISSAGARGLMQLMPATAKYTAKRVGLAYSAAKLNDPTYNITLGRAYLAGLLVDYDGSYVLSLAGYNAGPRRVMEWMGQNRDPRREGIDVIDWVESIPIAETRNYVQRVLENLQVYRHRLGGTQLAVSLEQDLTR
jgi:soluble lytic murein transglycosylase